MPLSVTVELLLTRRSLRTSEWNALEPGSWSSVRNPMRFSASTRLLHSSCGVTPGGAGLLYGHAGHRAPLAVLGASVESLGHAMIPCLLLLLGAELAPGPGAARLPPRGVAAAVGARLLVLPMLGAAFVGALLAWGALSPPDPMFVVVCLLPWATPAAVVLQVIAGRTHDAATSAAVAALLFWHYAAAMLTLPLGGVVALHFLLPRGEAGG